MCINLPNEEGNGISHKVKEGLRLRDESQKPSIQNGLVLTKPALICIQSRKLVSGMWNYHMFLQMLQVCVLSLCIYALYPLRKMGQSLPVLQEGKLLRIYRSEMLWLMFLDSNSTFPYWGLEKQRVQQEIHTKDQGRHICLAVRFHANKLEENWKTKARSGPCSGSAKRSDRLLRRYLCLA